MAGVWMGAAGRAARASAVRVGAAVQMLAVAAAAAVYSSMTVRRS